MHVEDSKMRRIEEPIVDLALQRPTDRDWYPTVSVARFATTELLIFFETSFLLSSTLTVGACRGTAVLPI